MFGLFAFGVTAGNLDQVGRVDAIDGLSVLLLVALREANANVVFVAEVLSVLDQRTVFFLGDFNMDGDFGFLKT